LDFLVASTTALANSIPPSPPLAQTSWVTAAVAPAAKAFCLISSISAGVSVVNLLTTTTAGTPKMVTFSICFSKFSQPLATESKSF